MLRAQGRCETWGWSKVILPVSDNDWEKVTKKGDAAIKKWIADLMHGRSCTVVLVGSNNSWSEMD